jgi:hypothetical protein
MNFTITRVVTRDFGTDFTQGIRNMFGMRLRGYEKMIDRNLNEMIAEMELKYKQVKWWRMSVNPLTSGGVMITIYGRNNE